ncbi:MAG: UTP--glucose-1-phosphate uridylyltransferase, partial [Tumebacillaceae bacterium]
PGAGGEIQLTDAIAVLNQLEGVNALKFDGIRYDIGEVGGFVKATIDFALRDPNIREETMKYMAQMVRQHEKASAKKDSD